ncbi:MAG: hydantoinase/oxoprolinase family protein [Candidatus Odinarchaeota archaeon]
MKIIGVDVGGTFTDIIIIDTSSGMQYVHKVNSTPENQEMAVLRGIEEILQKNNLSSNEISLVVHGTTVATNSMLERKGAHVVLLTTEGLEDVLEIGRQNREDIYDLYAHRPEPLVKREDRLGIHERLDSMGIPIIELTPPVIQKAISQIQERKPESVAISLLFSFRNSSHERILLEEVKKQCDIYSVASHEVLPEFREFERTSTTVLEAYLGPLVIGYLERLDAALKKLCSSSRFTVMQSNGGTMLASEASGKAVGLAISGLAGGVIGGWQIAKQNSVTKAITLDMGGTSCDISAVMDDIVVRPDNEVAGHPLRMPSVDVKTIGAGGGSIAWIDEAGILHVGPQSAGAVPGPAAYQKGGKSATVTDANLLLGRLNAEYFLGGNVKLNIRAARNAVGSIAKNLGMSIKEAALGIIRISTANMVQAIHEVTVERGSDPRQFVLVPFGGAGPTQSVDIAEALDIDLILVPPHPGITSALGLVCTDLRVDLMKTVLMTADVSNTAKLLNVLEKLSEEARNRLIGQGAKRSDIELIWSVDTRYVGQSHELPVQLPQDVPELMEESTTKFELLHEESFGYMMKERLIEWVTARVSATTRSRLYRPYHHHVNPETSQQSSRTIILNDGEQSSAAVFRRNDLNTGQKILGPAIIEQLDTTIYIGPKWLGEQQSDGTLWMRRSVR